MKCSHSDSAGTKLPDATLRQSLEATAVDLFDESSALNQGLKQFGFGDALPSLLKGLASGLLLLTRQPVSAPTMRVTGSTKAKTDASKVKMETAVSSPTVDNHRRARQLVVDLTNPASSKISDMFLLNTVGGCESDLIGAYTDFLNSDAADAYLKELGFQDAKDAANCLSKAIADSVIEIEGSQGSNASKSPPDSRLPHKFTAGLLNEGYNIYNTSKQNNLSAVLSARLLFWRSKFKVVGSNLNKIMPLLVSDGPAAVKEYPSTLIDALVDVKNNVIVDAEENYASTAEDVVFTSFYSCEENDHDLIFDVTTKSPAKIPTADCIARSDIEKNLWCQIMLEAFPTKNKCKYKLADTNATCSALVFQALCAGIKDSAQLDRTYIAAHIKGLADLHQRSITEEEKEEQQPEPQPEVEDAES